MDTKRCPRCMQEKPLTEFGKSRQAKNGHYPICKSCVSIEGRKRNNTDRMREYKREWARKNTENAKKYYLANSEIIKAKVKKWRNENRERHNAWNRQWSANNKEHERLKTLRYRQKNPGMHMAQQQRRRAMKSGAPINDFTRAQWVAMQILCDHRCAYCGKRRKGKLTQDHIQPLSNGGSHTLSNIVPACRNCNSRKGSRPAAKPIQPFLLIGV